MRNAQQIAACLFVQAKLTELDVFVKKVQSSVALASPFEIQKMKSMYFDITSVLEVEGQDEIHEYDYLMGEMKKAIESCEP